jgi:hypothetical protein
LQPNVLKKYIIFELISHNADDLQAGGKEVCHSKNWFCGLCDISKEPKPFWWLHRPIEPDISIYSSMWLLSLSLMSKLYFVHVFHHNQFKYQDLRSLKVLVVAPGGSMEQHKAQQMQPTAQTGLSISFEIGFIQHILCTI